MVKIKINPGDLKEATMSREYGMLDGFIKEYQMLSKKVEFLVNMMVCSIIELELHIVASEYALKNCDDYNGRIDLKKELKTRRKEYSERRKKVEEILPREYWLFCYKQQRQGRNEIIKKEGPHRQGGLHRYLPLFNRDGTHRGIPKKYA